MPPHAQCVLVALGSWPQTKRQGGELGIGPDFDGFRVLEEGTIALPPGLVVRGDRSLQSIPPHELAECKVRPGSPSRGGWPHSPAVRVLAGADSIGQVFRRSAKSGIR